MYICVRAYESNFLFVSGVGLHDIMRNVADGIGEDLIDALTEELDAIFDDYSNKFVSEI